MEKNGSVARRSGCNKILVLLPIEQSNHGLHFPQGILLQQYSSEGELGALSQRKDYIDGHRGGDGEMDFGRRGGDL